MPCNFVLASMCWRYDQNSSLSHIHQGGMPWSWDKMDKAFESPFPITSFLCSEVTGWVALPDSDPVKWLFDYYFCATQYLSCWVIFQTVDLFRRINISFVVCVCLSCLHKTDYFYPYSHQKHTSSHLIHFGIMPYIRELSDGWLW